MKRLLMGLLAVLLLTGTCFAVETGLPSVEESAARQAETLDLDGLKNAAGEAGDGLDPNGGTTWEDGLKGLWEKACGLLGGMVKRSARSAVLMLIIVLFGSLAGQLCGSFGEREVSVVQIVMVLALTAVAVSDAGSLMSEGRDALGRMRTFGNVLLPTMTAATAAMGAPAGAVARQMAALLFSDVPLNLIDRLLLPLVYAYLAVCAGYAVVGNEGLKRIGKLIKGTVTGILTGVLIAFIGYLSVSGAIAGSSDALTLKAAKFAMTSMVPVVGKILSDAAETVLAGAGILRGTVGVFGLLAVMGILLAPFLQMGVHYLAYKLSAAVSATVAEGRTAGMIDAIGDAFGLALGMTGASGVVLLISIVSAITVVVR